MQQEVVEIKESESGSVSFSRLVISVSKLDGYKQCNTVIGYPGLPNVKENLSLGDAVLYETTEDGIIEVRATKLNVSAAQFLVSQVSPRLGLGAALTTDDPSNLLFTEAERTRIEQSIETVKSDIAASNRHSKEQLELIYRKLDEIYAASGRMGRKDWLNYVAGSLTSLSISAAFSPDATKSLFQTVNTAFTWLFTNAPVLLQWGSAV